MAQLYTTGPCHTFVTVPSSQGPTQPLYLGTCEDAPRIELTPHYENVRNDIGGVIPFDQSYQGELAVIDLDLNRYNETVYGYLSSRPNSGAAPRGSNAAGDVGSLILTEGLAIAVYVVFGFGAAGASPKAVYTGNGMPPGYRFPACVPVGPDKLSMGTKPKKVHLMFFALRAWNPQKQSFLLYDTNVAGMPAIS